MKNYQFLAIVCALYVLAFIFSPLTTIESMDFAVKIIQNIIPAFAFVFVLMVLFDYFISPQKIKKHIGKETGYKRWLIAVLAGIISMGPIYIWYSFLKDLRNKGASNGFVATFLYARAIKLPLLPILVVYLGIDFTIILIILLMIFSLLQGLLIDVIFDKE